MKTVNGRAVLSVGCLTLVLANLAAAQDWPQWRGPNRDAKAPGFHAPETWPKELKKNWQVTVGDGVATPALVDGKLYVFTRQNEQEILRCLDAATGAEAWQEAYETGGTSGGAARFSGPRSSPTVAHGKVVTLGVRGILTCRDAATGKLIWQNVDFDQSWPRFYPSSSPIVVDGLCVAQLGGEDDGGIIAYDLSTGDEKWRWMGTGPSYGSPVLLTVDGATVIVAPVDRKLVAVADGKLLWEMPYEQGRYNAATPIVDGQTLIVAGPGVGMTAFRLKKDGENLVEEKLWSNTDNSVGFNTPVVKDRLLFGLSNADQLFCLNIENQATAWTAPFAKAPATEAAGADATRSGNRQSRAGSVPATFAQFVQQDQQERPELADRDVRNGERRRGEGRGQFGRGRGFGGRGRGRGMGRGGYGSIVDVGSALIALTPAGELVVFQPSDEAYSELARYKVAVEGTYAYPVATGNRIYVKDQNSLTLWTIE